MQAEADGQGSMGWQKAWKQRSQSLYRRIPSRARDWLRTLGPIAAFRKRHFESDTSLHDSYYTEEYYERDIAMFAPKDAPILGRFILEHFRPASVIDVGCGSGDFLKVLCDAGVEGHGVELATAGLKLCWERGLDVRRLDLTTAEALPWTADLVYSYEVAEHVPESSAVNYVRLLTSAARKHICLTAAPPGQMGLCHVNLQEKPYWIELFRAAGFTFDRELTARWERENAEQAASEWFHTNLMVFHAAR